jgi:FdhD protein
MKPPGSTTKAKVWIVENGKMRSHSDRLATEEPLEIRLVSPQKTVAVTMRTPGADFELAAGFLYSEGVVKSREDIDRISYCVDSDVDDEQRYNIINVALRVGLSVNLQPLERHFFTTSACGVCGKASLEALRATVGGSAEPNRSISQTLLQPSRAVAKGSANLFLDWGITCGSVVRLSRAVAESARGCWASQCFG